MRGPGASTYSDEVAAADEVHDVLEALASAGIEIKLGQIPAEQRERLADLTNGQIGILKRRKLDILRVLLARELLAEAARIRDLCIYPDRRTDRAAANPRRYADLRFSARALLPPGYDWSLLSDLCWSHQINYDGNGRTIDGAGYDRAEAEALLEEFKGAERGDDEKE